MRPILFIFLFVFLFYGANSSAKEALNIFTWEGYVTPNDIAKINKLLKKSNYNFEVKVIAPYAEGPDQMYSVLRQGEVDISFLTLYFINLKRQQTTRLIQPINTKSPRLTNYNKILPDLRNLQMGMKGGRPLYIPFAGGSYGFYIDRKKVAENDVPKTWKDLLDPKWEKQYSLNKSQVWYNVAIAAMALGKKPFYINDLATENNSIDVIEETRPGSPLFLTLEKLYQNAGDFWTTAPTFTDKLKIVSSWGVEVSEANRKDGDWRLIDFKEGQLVWLDTINFGKQLTGKKLEAAEIAANYFIGKEVQDRVSTELSLVSVSTQVKTNPILKKNPNFFSTGHFVPSYLDIADEAMARMSFGILEKIDKKSKY